jgi:hypothetical protein
MKIEFNIYDLFWGYFEGVCEGSISDNIGLLEKMNEVVKDNPRADGYERDVGFVLSPRVIELDIQPIPE